MTPEEKAEADAHRQKVFAAATKKHWESPEYREKVLLGASARLAGERHWLFDTAPQGWQAWHSCQAALRCCL
jgi:hypothetical protein